MIGYGGSSKIHVLRWNSPKFNNVLDLFGTANVISSYSCVQKLEVQLTRAVSSSWLVNLQKPTEQKNSNNYASTQTYQLDRLSPAHVSILTHRWQSNDLPKSKIIVWKNIKISENYNLKIYAKFFKHFKNYL